MEHRQDLVAAEVIDNLNDSIGSEIYNCEEKSVMQKIKEKAKVKNKTLYNSLGPTEYSRLFNRGVSHREFPNKININSNYNELYNNSNSTANNDLSKLQVSVTFTKNDSTEIYSNKKRNSNLNSISPSNSNYYSEELNNSNIQLNASASIPFEDKKKIHSLLKSKEVEVSELTKKSEALKKKFNERKKELIENKTECTRIMTINSNMKKMILTIISQKSLKEDK